MPKIRTTLAFLLILAFSGSLLTLLAQDSAGKAPRVVFVGNSFWTSEQLQV